MRRQPLTILFAFMLFSTFGCNAESLMSTTPRRDLDDGAFFGYQGWHLAKGDGRLDHPDIQDDKWVHWFENNTPDFAHIHGDFWTDFTDYEQAGIPLYDTQMIYPNGDPVRVYSCWDYATIDLHIKWLADYGLKGVFLQRQAKHIDNPAKRATADRVALHVWRACEKYNIKFAMMPANNYKDQPGDDVLAWRHKMVDSIINDWKYLVDELRIPGRPNYRITDSPMYVFQEDRNGINRPVIGLWGLGQANRPMTAHDAREILEAFHNNDRYHVYVMAGVPKSWRTEPKSPDWVHVYQECDMISPWRTVFGPTAQQIEVMRGDVAYCYDNGMDYNAVISAGASSRHMRDNPSNRNWEPRLGGQHLWDQLVEVVIAYDDFEVSRGMAHRTLPRFLYLAMYDEIDEGTALYKQAEAISDLPVNDGNDPTNDLVPLNEDGIDVDADFYLRLSKAVQDVLDGTLGLTNDVSIARAVTSGMPSMSPTVDLSINTMTLQPTGSPVASYTASPVTTNPTTTTAAPTTTPTTAAPTTSPMPTAAPTTQAPPAARTATPTTAARTATPTTAAPTMTPTTAAPTTTTTPTTAAPTTQAPSAATTATATATMTTTAATTMTAAISTAGPTTRTPTESPTNSLPDLPRTSTVALATKALVVPHTVAVGILGAVLLLLL